jgi:Ca2+-binding EF-hand superfamily protein
MKTHNRKLSELFNILDKNNDGVLNQEEVRGLFINEMKIPINEEQFIEFFDHFDVDRNDRVSVNEFVEILKPELEKID